MKYMISIFLFILWFVGFDSKFIVQYIKCKVSTSHPKVCDPKKIRKLSLSAQDWVFKLELGKHLIQFNPKFPQLHNDWAQWYQRLQDSL